MADKELFERALSEIKMLRNQNQTMKLRLDMFDDIMSALHGQPAKQQSGMIYPDIAYELEKRITQIGPSSAHPEQESCSETSEM